MIVPTLRAGMHVVTLRVTKRTQSVHRSIPTQSVGTIRTQAERLIILTLVSHRPLQLTTGVAFAFGITLVVFLLALA